MQVFLHCLQKHYQVVQIDLAVYEIQLTHAILHLLLEGGWHITESKRHLIALKEPQITHSEGCILF